MAYCEGKKAKKTGSRCLARILANILTSAHNKEIGQ